MKLPRFRPATVAAVIAAGTTVLYFFPVFPSDTRPDGSVEFRTYGVIGLALAACLVSGRFGHPGTRGWLRSLGGAVELIFYGGAIGIFIHGLTSALAASELREAGLGFIGALVWAEFGGLLTMLIYLADLTKLAVVLIAIAFVHLAARWERERIEQEP